MGDTAVELKYAHLLDIDTVWFPNTATYLNTLTLGGAIPDPIMLFSGPMDFHFTSRLDGTNAACGSGSRLISYWASFVDDQQNAFFGAPTDFKNTACLIFRCLGTASDSDTLVKTLCHEETRQYDFRRFKFPGKDNP